MPRPILAVDLDGTLCEVRRNKKNPMTKKDCCQAVPIRPNIDLVNAVTNDYFIVVYTARRNNLISASLDWLNRNGVIFDAISNKKMPADCYLDDKAINPHDL